MCICTKNIVYVQYIVKVFWTKRQQSFWLSQSLLSGSWLHFKLVDICTITQILHLCQCVLLEFSSLICVSTCVFSCRPKSENHQSPPSDKHSIQSGKSVTKTNNKNSHISRCVASAMAGVCVCVCVRQNTHRLCSERVSQHQVGRKSQMIHKRSVLWTPTLTFLYTCSDCSCVTPWIEQFRWTTPGLLAETLCCCFSNTLIVILWLAVLPLRFFFSNWSFMMFGYDDSDDLL